MTRITEVSERVFLLRAEAVAVTRLWVSDANTIAGTDGTNFFTKAGKVFTGETPHDRTDDRTGQ